MSNPVHEQHVVEPFFDAIANWVKKYRHTIGLRGELANCRPEEVARMARDIGLSSQELKLFINKGSHASDGLQKLLHALGVAPQRLAFIDPGKMRDLQRLCITCSDKSLCRHDLAVGTAAIHYHEYCPNAMSIDALFRTNQR